MTDKIAEIHRRHEFAEENKSAIRPAGFSWTIPGWQAHNDRSYLLAEVDRLTRERDEARAEVERLREEIRCLGLSEALAKHSGSSGREWHSVGAWLYAGETINHVIRSPRTEPEAKP